MAKKRKSRGKRRNVYSRKGCTAKMFKVARKGSKRRASAAVRARGAFTKMMWKKHRAEFLKLRKKKGGFGIIARKISAAFKNR